MLNGWTIIICGVFCQLDAIRTLRYSPVIETWWGLVGTDGRLHGSPYLVRVGLISRTQDSHYRMRQMSFTGYTIGSKD